MLLLKLLVSFICKHTNAVNDNIVLTRTVAEVSCILACCTRWYLNYIFLPVVSQVSLGFVSWLIYPPFFHSKVQEWFIGKIPYRAQIRCYVARVN